MTSSTSASWTFSNPIAKPRQDGSGRRFCVDLVGLAAMAAGSLVGLVQLKHRHPLTLQQPRQRRAVGPGALHAGATNHTQTSSPAQQVAVTLPGRRELSAASQDTRHRDDGGGVLITVGVDPSTTSSLSTAATLDVICFSDR